MKHNITPKEILALLDDLGEIKYGDEYTSHNVKKVYGENSFLKGEFPHKLASAKEKLKRILHFRNL